MTAPLTLLDIRATDGESRLDGAVEPGIRDTGEAFDVVVDGRPLHRVWYSSPTYGASKVLARREAEGVRIGYLLAQKDAAA
ncbi:MAG: hypothetical protein AAF580_15475 [Pseudomonadota bacterium]